MSILSELVKGTVGGETAYKNIFRKGGDVLAGTLGGFVGSGGNPLAAILGGGAGLFGDSDPLTGREFGQNALWSAIGGRAGASLFPKTLGGEGIPGLPAILGGPTSKPGLFQGIPFLQNIGLRSPITYKSEDDGQGGGMDLLRGIGRFIGSPHLTSGRQNQFPGIGGAGDVDTGFPVLPIALTGIGTALALNEGARQEAKTREAVERFQRSLTESGPLESQAVESQLERERQARERQRLLEQGEIGTEAARVGPEAEALRTRILEARRKELEPISARFATEEARVPEAYRELSTREAPLFSAQKAAEQGSIQDTIKAIEAARASQRAGIEQRTGETARKFFEEDITPSVMNALSRRGILDSGALQAQLAKEAARLQTQRESALLPFDIETSRATSLGLLPELIQSERDIGRQALGRNLDLGTAGLEEQRNIARSRLGQETAFDLGTSQAATLGLLPEALSQEQALRRASLESGATLGRQGLQSESGLLRDLLARRFGRSDTASELGLISDMGAQQRRGELLSALIESIGKIVPMLPSGFPQFGGGPTAQRQYPQTAGDVLKTILSNGLSNQIAKSIGGNVGQAVGGGFGNIAGNALDTGSPSAPVGLEPFDRFSNLPQSGGEPANARLIENLLPDLNFAIANADAGPDQDEFNLLRSGLENRRNLLAEQEAVKNAPTAPPFNIRPLADIDNEINNLNRSLDYMSPGAARDNIYFRLKQLNEEKKWALMHPDGYTQLAPQELAYHKTTGQVF